MITGIEVIEQFTEHHTEFNDIDLIIRIKTIEQQQIVELEATQYFGILRIPISAIKTIIRINDGIING